MIEKNISCIRNLTPFNRELFREQKVRAQRERHDHVRSRRQKMEDKRVRKYMELTRRSEQRRMQRECHAKTRLQAHRWATLAITLHITEKWSQLFNQEKKREQWRQRRHDAAVKIGRMWREIRNEREDIQQEVARRKIAKVMRGWIWKWRLSRYLRATSLLHRFLEESQALRAIRHIRRYRHRVQLCQRQWRAKVTITKAQVRLLIRAVWVEHLDTRGQRRVGAKVSAF